MRADGRQNAVHGSDSAASAERETAFHFPPGWESLATIPAQVRSLASFHRLHVCPRRRCCSRLDPGFVLHIVAQDHMNQFRHVACDLPSTRFGLLQA